MAKHYQHQQERGVKRTGARRYRREKPAARAQSLLSAARQTVGGWLQRIVSCFRRPQPTKRAEGSLSADSLPTSAQLEAELDRERSRRSNGVRLRGAVFALITASAAAIIVATVFLPVLQIYGTSMSPTLSEGNVVVSVKGAGFERGDIISFYYNNKILVKRAVAFEGEFVNFDSEGNLYINNQKTDEPYLSEDAKALGDCTVALPYQVPSGKVFVLGDNRAVSVDSRSSVLGCVSEEQIIGRVAFRVWPLNRFGAVG